MRCTMFCSISSRCLRSPGLISPPYPRTLYHATIIAGRKGAGRWTRFPQRAGDVRESVSRRGTTRSRSSAPSSLPFVRRRASPTSARLRSLRARRQVRGAEEPEVLSSTVSQRGHFLRDGDEPDSGRSGGRAAAAANDAYGRVYPRGGITTTVTVSFEQSDGDDAKQVTEGSDAKPTSARAAMNRSPSDRL